MSEQSFMNYKKDFNVSSPSLKEVEDFCFAARTRGGDDQTKVNLGTWAISQRSSLDVSIPEDLATGTFKEKPSSTSLSKEAIVAFILLPVLLVLGFILGGNLLA